VAERLLAALLGRSPWRESILGDLREEHVAMAAGRSRPVAALWYWAQSLSLGARHVASRFDHRTTPPIPTPLPARGDHIMRTLLMEARLALRSLRKRPWPTAIILATMALALGANAAIFGIVDALVIRPFPFEDVDRMVMLSEMPSGGTAIGTRERVSPANFLDWRRQVDTVEPLAAFEWWEVNLVGRDEPESVLGFFVSHDFFAVFGLRAAHGRTFVADDEVFGRHRVVVLGHGLWQRRFGGDPSIVGQPIVVDGLPHEVVGIAPPGFDFPMGSSIWAPLAFDTETAAVRGRRYLTVVGRLAAGRSLEDARAEMGVVWDRLAREYPEANRHRDIHVTTLTRGMMDEGLGPILSLWQASAVFVLLIACANVASLLLARGAERQREIAVRLAIGASRARMLRQLLVESLLLALAAVPLALVVTAFSLTLLRSYMPARLIRFVPGWTSIDVDGRLALVTTLLAIGTAIVFGLVPALQASRPHLMETLKEGGRTGTAGGSRQRLRRGLVVAEIALVLPLLVASGLSAMGTSQFLNGPQGYDPDGLLTLRLVLPEARYPDADARRRFIDASVERLAAVPGVSSAAMTSVIPSSGTNSSRQIEIDGRPEPDHQQAPWVDYRAISPGYFATFRVPMLSGRAFSGGDLAGTQPVAVVSESMAKKFWPGADPIGRRFRLLNNPDTAWITVVGVAGDVIHDWFVGRDQPTMYRPYAQAPSAFMGFGLRTRGDPEALASAARAAILDVDPMQPQFDVQSMRTTLSERTIGLQYISVIMGVFGGLALVLAIVGVYGVMAYMISQRLHEFGLRIALGATGGDVLRLVVGQAWRLTALGVLIGSALALALGRLIEAGLLGVASSDLRLLAGVAALVVVAAILAGYVPARRATVVDPMLVLRNE
jgi:putative ABC transport system permease protein